MNFACFFLSLFINLIFISKNVNANRCNKTFAVFCDHVSDYLNNTDSEYWQQLVVGSQDRPQGKINTLSFDDIFDHLPHLQSLTIINHHVEKGFLESDEQYIYKNRLQFWNFFACDFKFLEIYRFLTFHSLKELSIRESNVIKIIGHDFLEPSAIDVVDLSRNKIREISSKNFVNVIMKKLDLSHNRIQNIKPATIHNALEVLNLDYNNLNYILKEALQNLINLKELSVSHNKLSLFSDLSPLKQLNKLDFSHNQLTNVEDMTKFPNLQILDLSFNEIGTDDILSVIPRNGLPKKISLAFNSIVTFKIGDWLNYKLDAPTTILLFGNPLICECVDVVQEFFKSQNFVAGQCENELKSQGKIPYCVAQKSCLGYPENVEYFDNYKRVIAEHRMKLPCDIQKDMVNTTRVYNPKGKVGSGPARSYSVGNITVISGY